MILEVVTFEIKPGTNADFEIALEQAGHVMARAKGHLGHRFNRSMEQPNRYMLLIRWETLEDHTIGFRESDLFVEWRALIGKYFRTPPFVQHYETRIELKP